MLPRVKVVILAGGLGTRMREETEFRPKPMVLIGGEPLIWHIMRIFAAQGFREFLICAGYKGEQIHDYFSRQNWPTRSKELESRFPSRGIPESEWIVEVIDTGLHTPTGGRLKAIAQRLKGRFFCTYGDSLAPVKLNQLLAQHEKLGVSASVTLAYPRSRFGIAQLDQNGLVISFREKPILRDQVSIGFFVFEPTVLQLLQENSILENEPLTQLAASRQLGGYSHHGYWQPLDTYREYEEFTNLWKSGEAPWQFFSDK